jgi:hypothetical protein
MADKKEKRNAEIVKAYKSGKRAIDLAKAHGISKTRVYSIVKSYGGKFARRRWCSGVSDEVVDRAASMLNADVKTRAVRVRCNLNGYQVRAIRTHRMRVGG